MVLKKLAPLMFLLSCGCSGPSLVGKWTVTPSTPTMVPTTISATFAQPDQLTVYVEAKPEGPLAQDVKVEADVTGTWRIDGDSLSVAANEAAVKSSAGKNAATDFLAKQLEGQIKEAVTKSATGKMKWDGPDKLTVTSSDGTTAVLTRVKG